MDITITSRLVGARIPLAAAATAITLTVSGLAPPGPQLPSFSVPRVSTQPVALTANPFEQIWGLATGADSEYPLPAGVNPIAPAVEQLVRNLASYGGQLVAGQGGQIPGQIAARINNVGTVLQSVPAFLEGDIAVIPAVVVGGAFLGAIAGALLGGSIGQALFPDAEPGSVGEFVAYVGSLVGGYPGIVVGAAVGLVTAPVFWLADALRFRNSLAMALASPVPQPASATQPVAVAGVTSIDPTPGGTVVEPESDISTKPRTVPETDNAPGIRNTVVAALQAPSSQPRPEPAAAVSTQMPPASDPVEPQAGDIGVAPRLRNPTKHLVALAMPPTKKAGSPASDKSVSRPAKEADKPAAAGSHASEPKSGRAG